MSTEMAEDSTTTAGFPELTGLGTQLEMLRIGRGLSKQSLARQAGTSRQQLWRVMTGKSELTSSLRMRLAEVLQVDHRALGHTDQLLKSAGALSAFGMEVGALGLSDLAPSSATRAPASRAPRELAIDDYLCDCEAIARTLATLPPGQAGRGLKRALLNALEECAAERGVRLVPDFFALRGRVINDDV
jgi:transcriptional regulator with XRE-family HTH domain